MQTSYLPLPEKQEVVSHPVTEWNIGSAPNVSGRRNAQVEFTLMYWTYFPMPKSIQMAADGYEAIIACRGKALLYDENIDIHCSDKNLLASCVQPVLNMNSNSCVGSPVTVVSFHITAAYTYDNRFVWGDVYFLVLGKLKVWNSPCQESKEFFLVCIVPQKRFLRFGGILVYLSSPWSNLWYYSPYIYPKQCPPVYLIGDGSEWIGWRRFQHSYQM